MAPWKLPLIVAAIALPILGGFFVGGPGVGLAVGAVAAVSLLITAARQRPRGPIVPAVADDERRRVLVVVTSALEEPATVQEVARESHLDGIDGEAEVLVLAPARIRFLNRWTSDVEPARQRAQRVLVASVAALAKAGIAAEARVGDEDVVQAVEDQLQTFAANEVILISGAEEGADAACDVAAAELRSRLKAEFRHLVIGPRVH